MTFFLTPKWRKPSIPSISKTSAITPSSRPDHGIGLPIAGYDTQAKEAVKNLLDEIGCSAVDIGSIADSQPMEVVKYLYNKLLSQFDIINHHQIQKSGKTGAVDYIEIIHESNNLHKSIHWGYPMLPNRSLH